VGPPTIPESGSKNEQRNISYDARRKKIAICLRKRLDATGICINSRHSQYGK